MLVNFEMNLSSHASSWRPVRFNRSTLWLISSLAFRFYAVNFGITRRRTVRSAVPLWFYRSGLVIVIGAAMNAGIECPAGRRTLARRPSAPAADRIRRRPHCAHGPSTVS